MSHVREPRAKGLPPRSAPPFALPALLFTGTSRAEEPKISQSAALQMQGSGGQDGQERHQKRIDSRLYLALLHERQDPRLALLRDFRFVNRRRTAGSRWTVSSRGSAASSRSSTT